MFPKCTKDIRQKYFIYKRLSVVSDAPEDFKKMLKAVGDGVKTEPMGYLENLTVDPAGKTFQRAIIIRGETKKDTGAVKFDTEVDGKSFGKDTPVST